jgi:hypothetical protein
VLKHTVQCRTDPRLRRVLSDPESVSGDLDLVAGAPTRDETGSASWIEKVNRDRIVDDAAQSRWRHRLFVGAVVPSLSRE